MVHVLHRQQHLRRPNPEERLVERARVARDEPVEGAAVHIVGEDVERAWDHAGRVHAEEVGSDR